MTNTLSILYRGWILDKLGGGLTLILDAIILFLTAYYILVNATDPSTFICPHLCLQSCDHLLLFNLTQRKVMDKMATIESGPTPIATE